jgi:trehalose-phosphatase
MKSASFGVAGPRDSGLLMRDAEFAPLASRIIQSLTEGKHLLLLTDYDGTLTPIVPAPAEAWLPWEVREDLETLARSPRIHVGVVSGRDLADLRQRVAVPEAIYGGCHGLEIEGPGVSFCHPEALARQESLRAIGLELSRRSRLVPGMHVELKRFGVAVHYRLVAPEDVERVEMEIARALRQRGSRFARLHGAKVIEIQPRVNWTKGDCVRWIRDRVFDASGDRIELLCFGDDRTDEHMFEALAGQAITVRVGDRVPGSRAAHRLPDVASVQHLLAWLALRAKDCR